MTGMLEEMVRKWTATRVLGLDVEAARLNYAEVSQRDGVRVLSQGGTLPIELGRSTEALEKWIAQTGHVDIKVACALSSPELIVRSFCFPRVSKKEFQKAIRMEAEASVLNGHSLDDMVIDWHRTQTGTDSEAGMEGILAVVPRSLIGEQMEMFQKAGIRPAVMDVKALAVWNAFWQLTPVAEKGNDPILLINITNNATSMVIAQKGQGLFLVRDLEMGAHAVSADWLSEVRDSLIYARAKNGLKKLGAAYVTGSGALESVASDLASMIGMPVPIWDPLRYLKSDIQQTPSDGTRGPGLSVAVGLALREL